jgi:hypothetical protein
MSGVMTEARRLMPMLGDGAPASANAYFAMTGLVGMVAWGFTAAVYRLGSYEVAVPFSAEAAFGVGWAGLVTLVWLGVFSMRIGMAKMAVRPKVQFSGPGIVWVTTMAAAFVLNVVGLFVGSAALMWLPWAAGFAFAYTATGLMVERGGVFLLAGVASAGLTAYGLFVGTAADLVFPFLALGLLHSVPMLVDAARGGRELTDAGVPRLRADAAETDTSSATEITA